VNSCECGGPTTVIWCGDVTGSFDSHVCPDFWLCVCSSVLPVAEHFVQIMKLPNGERELRKTRKLLTATSPSDCDYQFLELSATHELFLDTSDRTRTDWEIPILESYYHNNLMWVIHIWDHSWSNKYIDIYPKKCHEIISYAIWKRISCDIMMHF